MPETNLRLPSVAALANLHPRAIAGYAHRCAARSARLQMYSNEAANALREEVQQVFEYASWFESGAEDMKRRKRPHEALDPTTVHELDRLLDRSPYYLYETVAQAEFGNMEGAALAAHNTADESARAILRESQTDYSEFVAAASQDFLRLLEFAGKDALLDDDLLDVNEDGPLGPLWPNGDPSWHAAPVPSDSDAGGAGKKGKRRGESDVQQALESKLDKAKTDASVHAIQVKHLEQELHVDGEKLGDLTERLHVATTKLDDAISEIDSRDQWIKDLKVGQAKSDEDRRDLLGALQQAEEESSENRQSVDELRYKLDLALREVDRSRPQSLRWYLANFTTPHTFAALSAMIILVGIVLSVINVISEIRGRQQLEQMLAGQITSLREDIVNSDVPVAAAPRATTGTSTKEKRQLIESYHRSRLLLNTLNVAGATETAGSFSAIRDGVQHVIRNGAGDSSTSYEPPNGTIWPFTLSRYSSDFLLSLIVVFSGTIGAVIAAIRNHGGLSLQLRDVAFGFAAGFITLLAIRGGKSVMVIQIEDVSFALNPYASAFLGLLAGLFTEKAYLLLRSFVNKLIEGIATAFDLKDINGDSAAPIKNRFPRRICG